MDLRSLEANPRTRRGITCENDERNIWSTASRAAAICVSSCDALLPGAEIVRACTLPSRPRTRSCSSCGRRVWVRQSRECQLEGWSKTEVRAVALTAAVTEAEAARSCSQRHAKNPGGGEARRNLARSHVGEA
eukprot:3715218-Pleurochrysis_carterae.AAC.1